MVEGKRGEKVCKPFIPFKPLVPFKPLSLFSHIGIFALYQYRAYAIDKTFHRFF